MAEPEHLHPREEPVRRDESIGGLARELVSDVGDLIRSELQLARREIRSDVATMGRSLALVAAGALVVLLGVVYLLLAAIFALSSIMSLGLAALIVGAVVLVVGAILAWVGLGDLKSTNPLPDQAIHTLREDAEWLRNRMR